MDEELLDEIGQLAEGIDSVLFAYNTTRDQLMPHVHLMAFQGKLKEARDVLARIYKENDSEEELNLQA